MGRNCNYLAIVRGDRTGKFMSIVNDIIRAREQEERDSQDYPEEWKAEPPRFQVFRNLQTGCYGLGDLWHVDQRKGVRVAEMFSYFVEARESYYRYITQVAYLPKGPVSREERQADSSIPSQVLFLWKDEHDTGYQMEVVIEADDLEVVDFDWKPEKS